MNEQLEAIIRRLIPTILPTRRDRQSIRANYDRIALVIKDAGFNEDVTHNWTVFALNRIFGSVRVVRAISA